MQSDEISPRAFRNVAALAARDSLDGGNDGVIEGPPRCRFDPPVLQCAGAESDSCLTAPQVAVAETGSDGWGSWITGRAAGKSLEFALGTQFFANMVFESAAWDYRTFHVDRDTKAL